MEITANAIQTVNAGQNVLFTDIPISGNCSIMYREGSGLVKLRGLSSSQCRARFRIFFGGNIAIPSGGTLEAINLSLSVDGEPVQTSQMIATPAAVNEYTNISTSLYLDVPTCCCSSLTVQNTSSQAINIQNANLIVERVA